MPTRRSSMSCCFLYCPRRVDAGRGCGEKCARGALHFFVITKRRDPQSASDQYCWFRSTGKCRIPATRAALHTNEPAEPKVSQPEAPALSWWDPPCPKRQWARRGAELRVRVAGRHAGSGERREAGAGSHPDDRAAGTAATPAAFQAAAGGAASRYDCSLLDAQRVEERGGWQRLRGAGII